MRTQPLNSETINMCRPAVSAPEVGGCLSELNYDAQNPSLLTMLLFPLLKQLGEQSRWQLWLTPEHKLNRQWLQQNGLPLEKSMQVTSLTMSDTLQSMIKALRSGNYSVVMAWLPQPLSHDERHALEQAAVEGRSLGLIMREKSDFQPCGRQENRLKIHSPLLH